MQSTAESGNVNIGKENNFKQPVGSILLNTTSRVICYVRQYQAIPRKSQADSGRARQGKSEKEIIFDGLKICIITY